MNEDAERYWQERVASGEFDDKDFPSSGYEVLVDFDIEDLLLLEYALHRLFVQIKKDRSKVIRAVVQVRRAMWRTMEEDEDA